jgi:ankyrin repeat protein
MCDVAMLVGVQPTNESVYYAAQNGVLQAHMLTPLVDVNWTNPDQYDCTPLHAACSMNRARDVRLLLSHPTINVNAISGKGLGARTPLALACDKDYLASVKLMLKCPRVRLDIPDAEGLTPFVKAAYWSNIRLVEEFILSGRELDLTVSEGLSLRDCVVERKRPGFEVVVRLLDDYIKDPKEARDAIRRSRSY